MTNTKSAQKRVNIEKRNRSYNQKYRNSIKSVTKNLGRHLKLYKQFSNISNKQSNISKKITQNRRFLQKMLDKGIKKKIFHKNTVARKKSIFSSTIQNI